MCKKLKLITITMTLFSFFPAAYTCEDKALEIEAGACVTKLWADIPISKRTVMESLGFIGNLKEINEKYGKKEEFSNFIERSKASINNIKYNKFAELCASVFIEENDLKKQKGIHILVEKVAQKYGKQLKELHILQEREKEARAKEESSSQTDINNDKLLELFLNADKAIHTH